MLGVLLRDVVQKVIETEGEPPDRVALTHPANWGSFRCVLSEEVARQARLKNLFLVTEPEAAAAYYTASRQLADGETVAVYDLGGGTFDTTVLRQSLGRTSRTWCVPRSSPLSAHCPGHASTLCRRAWCRHTGRPCCPSSIRSAPTPWAAARQTTVRRATPQSWHHDPTPTAAANTVLGARPQQRDAQPPIPAQRSRNRRAAALSLVLTDRERALTGTGAAVALAG
ncbi:MAG: Hsp70 family protein [Pseudonocardiaceae bacterium]